MRDTLLWGTPYRPTRRLGRGGMGEVFEAEHVGLAKAVVVKLLHRDLGDDPRLVARLRLEAQVLARLAHPNLVAVSDFGRTAEGRAYLAMERLYGRTLREELDARGALPARDALAYVAQALDGLAAAHGAGVVHRDVKLENLFLCDADPEGERAVKVLDFGIAKVVAPHGAARLPPPPPELETAAGMVVGTPRYLSPEQAYGRAVDARTDVYAAGVVLYTLLAGRGPFEHVGPGADLLRAHAHEVPDPPSRHAPSPLRPDLDRAVMRALEKDPARRFPSAASFAAELRAIAGRLRDRAAPPAAPRRWETTEPLGADFSPARAVPHLGPPPTEPLVIPPIQPRLDATLPDARPPPAAAAPPRRAAAVVLVCVASAALFGVAIAAATGLVG